MDGGEGKEKYTDQATFKHCLLLLHVACPFYSIIQLRTPNQWYISKTAPSPRTKTHVVVVVVSSTSWLIPTQRDWPRIHLMRIFTVFSVLNVDGNENE